MYSTGQRYILLVAVLVYSQVKFECKLRFKESYADAFCLTYVIAFCDFWKGVLKNVAFLV